MKNEPERKIQREIGSKNEKFLYERKLRRQVKKMKQEAGVIKINLRVIRLLTWVHEGEVLKRKITRRMAILKRNRKNRLKKLVKNLKRIQENVATQSGINGSETAQETAVADNQENSVNRDTEEKSTQSGKTAQENVVSENRVISENRVTEEKAIQTSQSDNQVISEDRATKEKAAIQTSQSGINGDKTTQETVVAENPVISENRGIQTSQSSMMNSKIAQENVVAEYSDFTEHYKEIMRLGQKARMLMIDWIDVELKLFDKQENESIIKKINQLLPDETAIKITVKVINDAISVDPKGGFGFGECFVGDETGNTIFLASNNDQMNLLKKGKFLLLTYARTKITNGIIKLEVVPDEGRMEIYKKAPSDFNVFYQEKSFIAKKVNQLLPSDEEINIIVKVSDVKIVKQKGYENGMYAECLVGDETAMIVFVARNNQVDLLNNLTGKAVRLYNAHINMYNGSMRLEVSHGNGGRIEAGKPVSFYVEKTNMSLIAKKVNQLLVNETGINITVKVIEVRNSKNGKRRESLVGDETGEIIFAARNNHHIDMTKEGNTLQISNGNTFKFNGEIRLELGSKGTMEVTEIEEKDVIQMKEKVEEIMGADEVIPMKEKVEAIMGANDKRGLLPLILKLPDLWNLVSLLLTLPISRWMRLKIRI